MSSAPNETNVREVVSLLSEIEEARSALRQMIPERDRLVRQCKETDDRLIRAQQRLRESFAKMDVDGIDHDNCGWVDRLGMLLVEFKRQILAQERAPRI